MVRHTITAPYRLNYSKYIYDVLYAYDFKYILRRIQPFEKMKTLNISLPQYSLRINVTSKNNYYDMNANGKYTGYGLNKARALNKSFL